MNSRWRFLTPLVLGVIAGVAIHAFVEWPSVWRYTTGAELGFPSIPVIKYNLVTRRVYMQWNGDWVRLSPNPPLPGDHDFHIGHSQPSGQAVSK